MWFFFDKRKNMRAPKRADIVCKRVQGVVQESDFRASNIGTKLHLSVKNKPYWYELRNGQAPQVFVGQKVILHVLTNMIVGIEFLNDRGKVILRFENLDAAHPEAAFRVTPLN